MYKNEDYLVNLYLSGEDFPEGFTIEEFEDTPALMSKAIEVSNDIKLYKMCSDKVKKDYNFVLKLIELFPRDKSIEDIANYFVENCDNEVERIRIFIAAYKKGFILSNSEDLEKYYTSSFDSVLGTFRAEPDIVEYIAYREANGALESIVTGDNGLEEQILHKYNLDLDKIDSRVIYIFLISLLSDKSLQTYIKKHIELIKGPYETVVNVLNNWNRYKAQLYLDKIQFLQEYLFRLKDNQTIDPKLLYYIAKRYDITDFIYTYEKGELDYTPEADLITLDIHCTAYIGISLEEKELIDAGFYLLSDKEKDFVNVIDEMFASQQKEDFDEYVYEAALNTALGKTRK